MIEVGQYQPDSVPNRLNVSFLLCYTNLEKNMD